MYLCVDFCHQQLITKFHKPVFFHLALGKEKLEIEFSQIKAIFTFWMNLLNTRHRKSLIFLFHGL